jgi:hypothetical protein
LRFPVALSLAAACLVPLETTWASAASAQEQAPAPALPALPASDGAPPTPTTPTTPPASSAERPNTVRVHVVTNAAGVQFLFRAAPDPTSSASPGGGGDIRQYSASCLAPCDLELPPGDYFVALSRAGGKAYEQPTPLSIRGATTIEGDYESHSGMRVAGIVLMSTLIPIGTVIAIVGAAAGTSTCSIDSSGVGEQCSTGSGDSGVIAVGVIALATGLLLGIAFAVRHDDAAVQVVPLATAPVTVPGATSERAPRANGLALRFAF